ncbi:MAG: hypothetical protein IPI92_16925 [Gemmatimonadetes bacterium]|nr:hypothetical protein [Gemmatimonadota bacterium]
MRLAPLVWRVLPLARLSRGPESMLAHWRRIECSALRARSLQLAPPSGWCRTVPSRSVPRTAPPTAARSAESVAEVMGVRSSATPSSR